MKKFFNILIISLWLISVIVILYMLSQGVRNNEQFEFLRYTLHTLYVIVLIIYIILSGNRLQPNNYLGQNLNPVIKSLGLISIIILLILVFINDDGTSLLLLFSLIAIIWILIRYFREIKIKTFITGLVLTLIAYLGGFPAYSNGLISQSAFTIFLILAPFMFICGSILLKQIKFSKVQLLSNNYTQALKSFIIGCLLFIPLGLFNAAEGSPGTDISWVTKAWMPITLPLFSGIVEEIWWRLLLISLCYILLIPIFKNRPQIAIIIAIFFSAVAFGLGHGRNINRLLTTGLLYGLPMAAIFAKKDFEHTVGAHYIINMIPWLVVYLEN